MLSNVDRLRLLQFLQQQGCGFRSLVAGSDSHLKDQEFCAYTGWYSIEWEGAAIEVALAPGVRAYSSAIGIADDAGLLSRFGAALEDYVKRPAGRSLRFSQMW
jgi:hypothetical protein